MTERNKDIPRLALKVCLLSTAVASVSPMRKPYPLTLPVQAMSEVGVERAVTPGAELQGYRPLCGREITSQALTSVGGSRFSPLCPEDVARCGCLSGSTQSLSSAPQQLAGRAGCAMPIHLHGALQALLTVRTVHTWSSSPTPLLSLLFCIQ